jgi:tRNA threonylcarbamoyladenosine biosynthesis protein TsaE
LVNEYDADIKVIHIDFYRENNEDRWRNIGINEYYNMNNIVIIEWGNLINSLLPDGVISINFEYIDLFKRKITSSYEPFSN